MTQKPSILVVDDEPVIRELMQSFLEDEGFLVLTSPNGHHAFQMLKQHRVDLLITDVDMPEGNGIELIEKVRSELLSAPTILVMTGRMEDKVRDLNLPLIRKPFDWPALTAQLFRAVDKT